jgi:peroxiredoxin
MSKTLLALTLLTAALAAHAAGPAPDFTLPRMDGSALRLGEQRGQVVMLNFWASWCAPCKQEMPHLNRLYDKYRDAGFVLLGVNVDDDPRKANEAAARMGLRFPVLLDGGKTVSRLYDLNAMPTTVVIDRDGRVRHVHQGYRNGYEAEYDSQIRSLVTE